MPNGLENRFGKTTSDAGAQRQSENVLQFGSATSYAAQMAILRKDDILKTSTYEFLLADSTGGICIPDDSINALDKFRVCVEASNLHIALSTKDPKVIQKSCDEINSNRDARAVFNQLSGEEKKQVHLEYTAKRNNEMVEALVPGPAKKAQ